MNENFLDHSVGTESDIDLKETRKMHFWCEELGLRSEDLRDIVRLVGPAVHDVRMYLAKKLLVSWPAHY